MHQRFSRTGCQRTRRKSLKRTGPGFDELMLYWEKKKKVRVCLRTAGCEQICISKCAKAITHTVLKQDERQEEKKHSWLTNRCLYRDVQHGSVGFSIPVSGPNLEAFGFHPELKFGVYHVAGVRIGVRVLPQRQRLEDFVVFASGHSLCLG